MDRSRLVALLTLVTSCLLSQGCTTTLTNMTPTRALEPKGVEVSVRAQGHAHSNVVGKTIAGGREVYDIVRDPDSEEPISEAQFREFIDASLAWFLFRPGANFEIAGRVGLWKVLEGWDLGVRWDFTTIKGDTKLQLYESDDEKYAISAIVGVGKQTVPVPGAVEWLTLTEWSRTDFDAQLSFGLQVPDFLHLYANPRVIVSRVTIEHKLPDFVQDRIPEEVEELDPNQLFDGETMVYWGASLGGMVGYKYVFLALELNAFKLEFEPTVLGETRKFDSLVLAPAIGLVGTF